MKRTEQQRAERRRAREAEIEAARDSGIPRRAARYGATSGRAKAAINEDAYSSQDLVGNMGYGLSQVQRKTGRR